MNKEPTAVKAHSAKMFTYAATMAFDKCTRQVVILATNIDDLRAAWYRMCKEPAEMDETRVQRVSLSAHVNTLEKS